MRKTKPKFGQNFLRDERAQQAIVDALGAIGERTILEIGPGRGAITRFLAERAGRLIAVELDRMLASELRVRFAAHSNVSIVEADVLEVDLCSLGAEAGGIDVVGNLPYYITSDILLALFAASEWCAFGRAVLMMQREVAERLVARPGVREYGVLSATTQLHASAEILFTLPPGAFSPPPDVESSVVRLEFRSRFAELAVDRDGFIRFIRASFAQKRKTLANNLRATGFSSAVLSAAWPGAIPREIRAEAVSLEAMAELYRALRATGELHAHDADSAAG